MNIDEVSSHRLTPEVLLLLAEEVEPPCVSMFVPLPRGAYDQRAARLDLKNLVANARASVSEHLRPHQTTELLAPVEEIFDESFDWSTLKSGFALFLSPTKSMRVYLPDPVEPLVMIGKRFDLLPLLPMMIPDYRFHVLSLSRNQVNVFEGRRHSFEEMHIPDLPRSVDDELWYEHHENALTSHGGPRLGSSRQPTAVIHGGQAWQDERKEMFNRFAQHLDRVLEPVLFATGAPLVIAAVEREVSAYRSVSRHPHLCEEAVLGNAEELDEHELHKRAWEIVRSELEPHDQTRLIDHFGELTGTPRVSVQESTVFDAASHGRVETLLLPQPSEPWTGEGLRFAGGVDDFVNTTVIQTIKHGGQVQLVPKTALPEGVTAGAIFRWAEG
jgi:Bacterial archaeo-eukaryotic release factor family 3